MTRLLFTSSRDGVTEADVEAALRPLFAPGKVLVTGGARGGDQIASGSGASGAARSTATRSARRRGSAAAAPGTRATRRWWPRSRPARRRVPGRHRPLRQPGMRPGGAARHARRRALRRPRRGRRPAGHARQGRGRAPDERHHGRRAGGASGKAARQVLPAGHGAAGGHLPGLPQLGADQPAGRSARRAARWRPWRPRRSGPPSTRTCRTASPGTCASCRRPTAAGRARGRRVMRPPLDPARRAAAAITAPRRPLITHPNQPEGRPMSKVPRPDRAAAGDRAQPDRPGTGGQETARRVRARAACDPVR